MPRWIVKVNRYREQVRITIPKMLAVESGLFGAELAEVRLAGKNILEVIRLGKEELESGNRERNSD